MQQTTFFTFDAETDGLYGETFAIGAAVIRWSGEIIETFSGIASAETVRSAWVRAHSLPHLYDLPVYAMRDALLDAFWAFYLTWRGQATIVADVPYPVEAQLLSRCIEKEPERGNSMAPIP